MTIYICFRKKFLNIYAETYEIVFYYMLIHLNEKCCEMLMIICWFFSGKKFSSEEINSKLMEKPTD